ncbi:hypothetical protein D3C80_1421780 [compost metagenome]
MDRFGPFAVYRIAGDQIVMAVLPLSFYNLNVCINEPERIVAEGELRSPYTAGIGVARHIKLTKPI